MKWLVLVLLSGLLLVALTLFLVVAWAWPPEMGLDLRGGMTLIYEVDRESIQTEGGPPLSADQLSWDSLV